MRRVLVLLVSVLALAWLTYPLILYPYHWFVRPLYFSFRYASVRREFPMLCTPLPPGRIDGQYVNAPSLLRFEANPNFGIVISAGQPAAECGKTTAILDVDGYRYRGMTGFQIVNIGGAPYRHSGVAELRIECPVPCRDPGQNPLDAAVCGGPCSESKALQYQN
jgi:hypothetical protein